MVELEFNFLQMKTIIQANLDDLFHIAIRKFCNKNNIKEDTVFFMAEGILLQGDKKIRDIMNQTKKRDNKINLLVYSLDRDIKNENAIIESKEIICPKCFELCRIKIEDYMIKLFDCKNNHFTEINLDQFKETQKIDLCKNICSE